MTDESILEDVVMTINLIKQYILFSCQSLIFLIVFYFSMDLMA